MPVCLLVKHQSWRCFPGAWLSVRKNAFTCTLKVKITTNELKRMEYSRRNSLSAAIVLTCRINLFLFSIRKDAFVLTDFFSHKCGNLKTHTHTKISTMVWIADFFTKILLRCSLDFLIIENRILFSGCNRTRLLILNMLSIDFFHKIRISYTPKSQITSYEPTYPSSLIIFLTNHWFPEFFSPKLYNQCASSRFVSHLSSSSLYLSLHLSSPYLTL